jgi:trk system potassium uptake protein TrkA
VKILIAGDGKVGSTLTKQLSAEDHDLTLIDSNRSVLDRSTEEYDVMAIQGNCAARSILLQAGVEDADLLIAVTDADEINLLCCTTAHRLNPNLRTIARVRNPDYIDQMYEMRDLFALSLAINPERSAAIEIYRLLKLPGFLKRTSFAKGRVEIVELRVDAKSKLCNVTLSNLNDLIKCQVLICCVLRNGEVVIPSGTFVLREGDRIFVTAPTNTLALLLKNLGILTRKVGRVILCGGGRVSYYLAQMLERNGVTVQLIEQDPDRCRQLAQLLPGTCVILGDASSQDLLESEGIESCDAIVTLTGLDELNILVSLYANSCGVPQIITKVGRINGGRILDSLPLGSTVCPKELCCNTIVRYVRAMQNQTGAAIAVHAIADGNAEAAEFLVDETTLHCGEPLKRLKLRPNVLIACITRGSQTDIPNGDSHFEKGDSLVVVSHSNSVLHQLNDIFA